MIVLHVKKIMNLHFAKVLCHQLVRLVFSVHISVMSSAPASIL